MEIIKNANADILCLQELRSLDSSKIKVYNIVSRICELGYLSSIAPYSYESSTFYLGVFYKPNRFALLSSERYPLETKNRIILSNKFKDLQTKKYFQVYVTHLSMEEDKKYLEVDNICNRLYSVYLPWILAGDFNFFDDLNGKDQRQTLLNMTAGSQDLAFPVSNASGTFLGFEHDTFKQPVENMSRLDHIFASDINLVEACKAEGIEDRSLLENRTYPSDHLCLSVTVSIDKEQHFDFIN